MNSQTLTIYGAVTRLPLQYDSSSTKIKIKGIRDRLKCKLGNFSSLDYRDYLAPGSYNKGDLAIAQSVTQKVQTISNVRNIDFVNWGELYQKSNSDPVLISGSGYIHITKNHSIADRLRKDLDYFLATGRSYALHGVGVNMSVINSSGTTTVIDRESQYILQKLVAGAKQVSVRDYNSQKIFEKFTGRNVTVIADPALFLKDAFEDSLDKRISEKLTIGITIPFHGPAATDRVRHDLFRYIKFLKALQQRTGCNFIQTIHFDSEFIIGKIIQDHGVRMTQAVGNVQVLINAYRQMDFHIGGMLHSCILSASVGTPCIGLAYDVKHQGFFDLLGQPDLCIPAEPFDPERLGAACDHVLSQSAIIREQINTRRAELEGESNRFLTQTLQSLLR